MKNPPNPIPKPPRKPSNQKRRARPSEELKSIWAARRKSAAAEKRNNAVDAKGRSGFGSFSFPKSGGANASEKRRMPGLRAMRPGKRYG